MEKGQCAQYYTKRKPKNGGDLGTRPRRDIDSAWAACMSMRRASEIVGHTPDVGGRMRIRQLHKTQQIEKLMRAVKIYVHINFSSLADI